MKSIDPVNIAALASFHDPVFSLIERHKRAEADYYSVLKEVPAARRPGPEMENFYLNREANARQELVATTPTTLAGLYALVAYVDGVSTGEFSPNGKPDIAFDEDDLAAILANARKCLKTHFSASA
jgi:hypothetical protein